MQINAVALQNKQQDRLHTKNRTLKYIFRKQCTKYYENEFVGATINKLWLLFSDDNWYCKNGVTTCNINFFYLIKRLS